MMVRVRHLGLAVLTVSVLASVGSAQAQDIAAGKKVFAKCGVCHIAEEAKNKVGPTLHGVFGRAAGSVEGFKYSDAMKNSGITWDASTIDQYLADPKGFVPKNKMAFAGLKKPEDRANVIAYLQQFSK